LAATVGGSYSIAQITPTKPSKEERTTHPLANFLHETKTETDSSMTPIFQGTLAEEHGLLAKGSQAATAAPPGKANGWGSSGDFGAYMASKIKRLREAAAAVENSDDLFRSVCVWVTGLTNPPSMELRQLIRVRLFCHSHCSNLQGSFCLPQALEGKNMAHILPRIFALGTARRVYSYVS
jgi:hypothetical protein